MRSRPRCLADSVYDPPAELVAAELDSSYGTFTGKADKVEVLGPASLRKSVGEALSTAAKKYADANPR